MIAPATTSEVTFHELIRIWKHCKNCMQKTETNQDSQNYLYAILPSGLWPYFFTGPYPAAPPDPGKIHHMTTAQTQPQTPPSETNGRSSTNTMKNTNT